MVNSAERPGYQLFRALALATACAACSAEPDDIPTRYGTFGQSGAFARIDAGSGAKAASAGKGGSAATTDPSRCVEGKVDATRVTPRVILVLDGSCSMSTDYPANGQESASECTSNPNGRWTALRRALVDPQNGVVAKLQHVVQFGAVVFGTEPKCPIPGDAVPPGPDNFATIDAKIPQVQPGMYTPTGPALDWVYDNLITANTPDGNNGPQIVILATDGEPNSCGTRGGRAVETNYQPSIDAVKKGHDLGVATYIFSLADATGAFHDHLQELANLGSLTSGSAKLYEPTSPAELSGALETLIGAAVSCDVALSGTVTVGSECMGLVTLNGQPLVCNDPNGWSLLDARHIRVAGTACKALMDRTALIEARFPCNILSPD